MSNEQPHRRKGLPLSQSILWVPGGSAASPGEQYHVFLHQRALNALHEHLRSSPDKGILGFLLGHLYQDPGSAQRFAVIELVMRLTMAIYGDKTTVVVSRVWDKMQEELARSGTQLLGWYHSHPPEGIELAPGDLETHATYFGQPWQWALVVATGERGASAGLYHPNRDSVGGGAVLPFYELLDPRSVTPEGKKRSSVRWGNYKPLRPPAGVSTGRSGPVPAVPDQALSFKPAAAPPSPPVPKTAPPPPPKAAPPPPKPAPLPAPPPVSAPMPPPPPPMRPAPTLAAELGPVGFVDQPPPSLTASGRQPAIQDPGAPPPRRISRPQPRFLLAETPRRASRAGLVLGILAFVVVGAAATWYFKFGPGSRGRGIEIAPPAADTAAVRDTTHPATDSASAVPPESVTVAVPTPVPTAVPPPAPAPAAVPDAARGVSMATIDRLSDSLVSAIQGYQERIPANDCTLLGRGLVLVESGWAAYNAEKRKLTSQLDAARTTRDLTLYSSVDTVEAHFDRSGCRRP